MNFNRYFLPDVEGDLLNIVDFVIVGPGGDDRSAELPRRWAGGFKGTARCLPYEVRSERCALLDMELADEVGRQNAQPSADIVELYGMVEGADLNGKNVLIDFTGMEQPAIFYLTKCLREHRRARRIFGLYTEPLLYKTLPGPPFEEAFDLTEEFIAFRALPGFVRAYDRRRGRQLLVYMGFEGRRFLKVFEEVNPGRRHTHAVFGIPAFQPGWQYLTLGSNQAALEISRPTLHQAEANNIFDAHEIACRVADTYPDLQLVLAPIGTKPHAVGAAICAAQREDVLIIYDFPIKQRFLRTVGVGKTSVYNLTELLLG